MKRYVRANSTYTSYTTIYHGRQKFSVHYTPDEYSGMVQAQITEIHPYDDAEYAWAKIIGPQAIFYRNGKQLDKMTIGGFDADNYEDDDTAYNEYLNEVFDDVAVELLNLNKNVKPMISHW